MIRPILAAGLIGASLGMAVAPHVERGWLHLIGFSFALVGTVCAWKARA